MEKAKQKSAQQEWEQRESRSLCPQESQQDWGTWGAAWWLLGTDAASWRVNQPCVHTRWDHGGSVVSVTSLEQRQHIKEPYTTT